MKVREFAPELRKKRRQVAAEAVRQFRTLLGVDLSKLEQIRRTYYKQMEEIEKEARNSYEEKIRETSAHHASLLARRLSEAKKLAGRRTPIAIGDRHRELKPGNILPCWPICPPYRDFSQASACDCEAETDLDVESAAKLECDCQVETNRTKPYLRLDGPGDGLTNDVRLMTWVGFNIDQRYFRQEGLYRLIPTVLVNGYWIKENWGVCDGHIHSEGSIELVLTLSASQLGGTKSLGTTKKTVFQWAAQDGFTGNIDRVYNVPGACRSEYIGLDAMIDPADGDVFVHVGLEIRANMTGNGRYVVDLRNNTNSYLSLIHI